MKNREVFDRDPVTTPLANNGQARITDKLEEKEVAELRSELSTFVCEGQYEEGIRRIIESYLGSLNNTNQPAAWVSGFFGSGKSHLLKMLCHLWSNTTFDTDGATARSLVPRMPHEVQAVLKELDTRGRQSGGLHAASGTLPAGSGQSVRLTVLGIVLRSKGLPESYAQAKFCLWLAANGHLDGVQQAVTKAGKDFTKELNNLYVSPIIAEAVLKADPNFAPDLKQVRTLLKENFPQRDDITTGEFIGTIREVLSVKGQIPCTIIVLDEVQQYIGDITDRAVLVTEVAEALCKQLDSRVLLVGAGQTALSGTPLLQRLKDRFTITVELSDTDVETVTRKVLLSKKPDKVDAIKKALASQAGEIERQLASTAIGTRSEDRNFLVDDYPLLPVRRRFWEHAFRAVDAPGTTGQLRTQLRIVHDALKELAEEPVGTVVAADFMFEQLQPDLLRHGVLLRELDERIRTLDNGTDDGRLARRLCGLIFLIRKLPRDAGVDTGVRATAEMLGDLVVRDLANEGPKVRKEVPRILVELVEKGILIQLDDEYSLQTRESSEWEKEFRTRVARLNNNENEVAHKRDALLRDAANEAVLGVKLQHGKSKESRKLSLHFGEDAPQVKGQEIPVWVRDGWNTGEKEILSAAREAGSDSPIIFVYVPKASADDLKKRTIEFEAAESTLQFKGVPSTAEGREARSGMETRKKVAEAIRNELVTEIVRTSKVFQGGGTEMHALGFPEKIKDAGEASLDRLFPRFREADIDARKWELAITRARNRDESPLSVLDWTGPTEQHPVCKAVLAEIGSGKKGRDIRGTFENSPYGWPRDAVDAALISLHAAGHTRATYNGTALIPGQLDQAKVPVTEFRVESVNLTARDRIKIRGLFQTANVSCKAGEEELRAGEFLGVMDDLAKSAGGDAPLPDRPATFHLAEIKALAGNEQLAKLLEKHDELQKQADAWSRLAKLNKDRWPRWETSQTLLAHAGKLPIHAEINPQAEAIVRDRSLLEPTDHVSPLCKKLEHALREALKKAHGECQAAFDRESDALGDSEAWKKITKDQQNRIAKGNNIVPIPELDAGDEHKLAAALGTRTLDSWGELTAALPTRFSKAKAEAAKELEPKTQSVSLRSETLRTEADVKAWLAKTESDLLAKLKAGPIVVG